LHAGTVLACRTVGAAIVVGGSGEAVVARAAARRTAGRVTHAPAAGAVLSPGAGDAAVGAALALVAGARVGDRAAVADHVAAAGARHARLVVRIGGAVVPAAPAVRVRRRVDTGVDAAQPRYAQVVVAAATRLSRVDLARQSRARVRRQVAFAAVGLLV